MSMPRAAVRKISDVLERDFGFGPEGSNRVGNAEHKCSAEAYAKLPSLKFNFAGIEYSLPKTDWLPRREGKCVIQIMRQEGQLFLGINWFNTYYTAFDMEKKRIGFAESVYSNLSPAESKEFNAKVLVNLSSTDLADWNSLIEQNATENKFETATIMLVAAVALVFGAIVYWSYRKQQKRSRAIDIEMLYTTLVGDKKNTDDETFEVPLNDDMVN